MLIGVAKTVPPDLVAEAIAAGLEDVGESRVQEARDTIELVGRAAARWHMIGHLQRNKVAKALQLFDRIHGVDSVELAEAVSRHSQAANLRMPVLVQVNVSGEPAKHGVTPDALEALLARVAELPGLALDGLMSIGAPVERIEDARREFARTRELRERAERALGLALPQLSMGMSGDYEVAVEEGSTMVRVGTALFGQRAT
jgi:pyridoxal phosphate enzyme (YggS family)